MRQPLTRPFGGAMIDETKSIPAPVGGWNARESVANMGEADAVLLDNFWPTPSDVMLRRGYSQFCTGFGSAVESLMSYQAPAGTSELYAVAGTEFRPVASGAVGAAVVTGLTNALWESVNFTNADPTSYLCCFNGVDAPRYWNGSAWITITGASTPAITGVTTTKLKAPLVHKRRLWTIETGSLRAWYLPVDAVGGAASKLDLAGIAMRGGSLVALASWTIDGGDGVDDYWVAITTEGEVIAYRGTDPDSAATWTLQGVWQMGQPIGGARCVIKFGGDILYNSTSGLVPLARALLSALTDERIAVSDKIQSAMQDAALSYGSRSGWDLMFYPGAQMVLVNVPITATRSDQYVMNTVSGAWARFRKIFANCWAMHDGIPYFGGSTFVGKFWQNDADNVSNIVGDVEQAYNYFGERGRLKSWTMCRPVFLADSKPAVTVVLNTDFAEGLPNSTAGYVTQAEGLWDVAVWDVGVWGGELSVYRDWQTLGGTGIAGSLRMRVEAQNIEVRWQATDWVYQLGGVL